MKPSRLSAALIASAALISLAACGGGGGGSPTPPTNQQPPPVTGSTPTPSPTGTPAPTPTPTATPTSSSSATVDTSLTLNATEDFGPNGALWYTSGTASWANTAGDLSTSQAAGGSATVDGMQCANTVEGTQYPQTAYSQHMFVGIYYNGTEQALPQALGMVNPVAPTQGTPQHSSNTNEVEQYQCEYNIHTHDYSGLVHIEDASQPQTSSYSFALPYATLQSLFDLWGAQLSANGIVAGSNSLSGPVTIYTGVPSGRTSSGADLVNSYTQYTGSLGSVPLARHNVIWIVIGNYPSAGLPEVQFGEEN